MKKKLVVLSGAGISAESGLRTFRDSDGLWEGYDVNEVATPRGWIKNPEMVLDFYNMRRKNVRDANPNAAHLGLFDLEKYFDLQIITQNIDIFMNGQVRPVFYIYTAKYLKCAANWMSP